MIARSKAIDGTKQQTNLYYNRRHFATLQRNTREFCWFGAVQALSRDYYSSPPYLGFFGGNPKEIQRLHDRGTALTTNLPLSSLDPVATSAGTSLSHTHFTQERPWVRWQWLNPEFEIAKKGVPIVASGTRGVQAWDTETYSSRWVERFNSR